MDNTMHLCGIKSLLLLVLVQDTHDAGLTLGSFRGNNIEAHMRRVPITLELSVVFVMSRFFHGVLDTNGIAF